MRDNSKSKEKRQGRRIDWDTMYQAAVEYHQKHGHIDIPAHYINDDKLRLGRWIVNMREAYRKKDPNLTGDKIIKLDRIGMVWKKLMSPSWDDFYQMAADFYYKHGHLDISKIYTTEQGYFLGRWLHKVKKAYYESDYSLSEDQKRRLELIGINRDL